MDFFGGCGGCWVCLRKREEKTCNESEYNQRSCGTSFCFVLFCFLVKYIQAASMLLFSKDLAFKGIKNLDIFVKELIR